MYFVTGLNVLQQPSTALLTEKGRYCRKELLLLLVSLLYAILSALFEIHQFCSQYCHVRPRYCFVVLACLLAQFPDPTTCCIIAICQIKNANFRENVDWQDYYP